ncbi:TPA: helix-turn-helix domain-containing protein [Legionella pneumophila]|jgi:transcriptional regulator with XRE-family HTH domain|uniref:Helix-turn-helix transcriptional regulator n=1 Tax=Legionella pneumophila TaxID=446 RepID=A0AAN5R6F6_LEGPN|nr:helix-turn-helix transcriptional regulator [Legionella pneumophila]HAT1973523.1 helix-turn-helix transcriptional regulator [Legionella pneumophila]HAT6956440.1 helix-turn-helix domain-containing protein [Legionella pneumophila]HEN4770884.1 helix-turn-helix transcriptional regulator [Legionella pneumophila]
MNLGRTIKHCRIIKRLTLTQLSESSGVSISHLCLLEKNKREPSLAIIETIAKALGLPLSVLIFLAAQKDELIDLSASQIETLSKAVMDLMSDAKK